VVPAESADASYKDVHHNNLHNHPDLVLVLDLVLVRENVDVEEEVDKIDQEIDVDVDYDNDDDQALIHKAIVKTSW
jgi:hypothetical protein